MTSLQDIIRDHINTSILGGREVGYDDELLLSGVLDSIGIVRLCVFIEEEFDVIISAADMTIETMESVRTISAFVEKSKT